MAIAFDAASEGFTNGATSVTFSHTCTGTDLILFVGVMASSARTISSVTYNGAAMTNINRSAGGQPCALYYLINPATGAHDVVATIDSSSFIYCASGSYTGAKQSAQPDANNTNSVSGTSIATNLTTVADNSWAVYFCRGDSDGDTNAGTNCTERIAGTGLVQFYDSGAAITPAGSFTMTATAASQALTAAMASFSPSLAVASSRDARKLTLLGVG